MAPQTNMPSPAMTTPFVQPPSCQSIFSSTEITDYPYTTGRFYTSSTVRDVDAPLTKLAVLVSNSADARFSTCQPSGWDQGEYPFSFTSAVCPSGWVMYRAQARDVYYGHSSSAAYCCASGYTINSDSTLLGSHTLLSDTAINVRCVSSIPGPAPFSTLEASSATTTTSSSMTRETSSLGYNTLYPAGIAIHHPYSIQWHTTDQQKLTPRPPDLPCDVTLATWTPGSPVATESLQCSPGFEDRLRNANQPHEVDHRYDALLAIVIVLPILGFLAVSGCVCCCIRAAVLSNRRKRIEHWKANRNGTIYPTLEAAREALHAGGTVVVSDGTVEKPQGDSSHGPGGERERETETVEEVPPVGETNGDGGGGTRDRGEVVQTDGR